jgi:arylsulfatase A-like enzyme
VGLRYHACGICLALLAVSFLSSCTESSKLERPNIILIVSDALRPDHLGCYGYGRPTSPTIDSLAQHGILFENAVAQAPWTKASFSSMFTSLYVFQHKVTNWGSPMADSLETLAEILARHGYETACVMNMIGLHGRFRVLQGFKRVSAAGKLERDAGISTTDAIELMKESGEPFFLVLHYFDTHRPYTPGSGFYQAVNGEALKDTLFESSKGVAKLHHPPPEVIEHEAALLDACIRYMDHCTGQVLSYLRDSGLEARTFVLFTADHGDGYWEHGTGDHAKTVYDEEIRVPLIAAGPEGYWKPRRIAEQVELIDLYPTILDLAGIEERPAIEGMSLVPLITGGRRVENEDRLLPPGYTLSDCTALRLPDVKCIRRRDWKIIIEPSTARLELYDLLADPGETVNLYGRGLAVQDTMMDLLGKVPGITMGGWRVAFIRGQDSTSFEVRIRVPQGAHIEDIDKLTQCRGMDLGRSREGWSLEIKAAPQEMDVLRFTLSAEEGPLTFEVTAPGGKTAGEVLTGSQGSQARDTPFTLSRPEAFGAPEKLKQYWADQVASVHIWWLPGDQAAPQAYDDNLTVEERKRLRALGYIQ